MDKMTARAIGVIALVGIFSASYYRSGAVDGKREMLDNLGSFRP